MAMKLEQNTMVNSNTINVTAPDLNEISELNKKLKIINGSIKINADLIVKLIANEIDFNPTGIN